MPSINKVAIFGAAGAIGRAVAPELERRGISFRAVGRDKAKLQAAFGQMPHAEVFDADLTDLRSAGAAARGMDTIIYTVGVPYTSFQLHPAMIRTAIEAAATTQVAPTILKALGLNPSALEAVKAEGTPVLPDVWSQLAK